MALSNGPYYENPTQSSVSSERGAYPDIISTTSPSARMRPLTDESLPVAQGDHQLNGLPKAATATGSQDTRYLQNAALGADGFEPISTPLGMIGRCDDAISFAGDP